MRAEAASGVELELNNLFEEESEGEGEGGENTI